MVISCSWKMFSIQDKFFSSFRTLSLWKWLIHIPKSTVCKTLQNFEIRLSYVAFRSDFVRWGCQCGLDKNFTWKIGSAASTPTRLIGRKIGMLTFRLTLFTFTSVHYKYHTNFPIITTSTHHRKASCRENLPLFHALAVITLGCVNCALTSAHACYARQPPPLALECWKSPRQSVHKYEIMCGFEMYFTICNWCPFHRRVNTKRFIFIISYCAYILIEQVAYFFLHI